MFNYHEVPIVAANFDKTKVLKEWCSFQVTRKRYYKDFTAKSLWQKDDTREDCLLIAGKNSNWSEHEKEEILNKAVEKYRQKKQKTKIVYATKESVLTSHIGQTENNDSSRFFLQQ